MQQTTSSLMVNIMTKLLYWYGSTISLKNYISHVKMISNHDQIVYWWLQISKDEFNQKFEQDVDAIETELAEEK